MTNYNDGNWYGWNGGECPVHPKSKVEAVIRDPDGLVRLSEGPPSSFRWGYLEGRANVIAFRVVKEHREPREWWIAGGCLYPTYRDAKDSHGWNINIVHVREVLE